MSNEISFNEIKTSKNKESNQNKTDMNSISHFESLEMNELESLNKEQEEKIEKKPNKKENNPKSIPFLKILFHFANKFQTFLIVLAILSSFIFGYVQVILELLITISMNHLDRNPYEEDYIARVVNDIYLYMIVGMIIIITGFGHCFLWIILGNKLSLKFKKKYFKLIMKQNQVWFDAQNIHKLSAKINRQQKCIESAVIFIKS